jgi:predicted Zn-dependent protease
MRGITLDRRTALLTLIAGGAGTLSACGGASVNVMGVDIGSEDVDAVRTTVQAFTMSDQEEIEIGETGYGPLVDQTGGRYANRDAQADLERFSSRMFEGSQRSFPWEITLIDNNEPNAWVLPGGKVGVNKGLVRYAANEHELAAVIAHEMGHAEESHAVADMRRRGLTDLVARVGSKAADFAIDGASGEIAGEAVGALVRGAAGAALSGYSRGAELEADAYIVTAFQRTGHDPKKGAAFYDTLLELIPEDTEATTSLYAGHPQTRERIRELETKAQGVEGQETTALVDTFQSLKRPFPTRQYYRRTTTTA